jgi:hypothetical protein
MKTLSRASIFIIVFVTLALNATAQISPGELSKYHAKLEGLENCTKCHALGEDVTNENCLACHTLIRDQIAANRGYHSSSDVKGLKCSKCHAEHYDREFELVHWKEGKENFDHSKTGWALLGAHKRTECRNCHTPNLFKSEAIRTSDQLDPARTFLGLTAECLNCHVNEHQGRFAENCLDCHTQDAWKPASGFDHAKTKYPLTGKHLEVSCEKCHALTPVAVVDSTGKIQKKERVGLYAKYDQLEFANCTPCHHDAHKGKFGTDCASCHTTLGLQQAVNQKFDHSKTGFTLLGKHIGLDCVKCHKSGSMTDPVPHQRCSDCHRDIHRGQFADRADGGVCESCHTVTSFSPANYDIAQHNQSRYPLTGSHLAVPCIACHQAISGSGGDTYAKYDFADISCKGCHADVHRGQLEKYVNEGGCEYCHNTTTWHQVGFDHSKTRFPLIGKHESTACMGCHTLENAGTDTELVRMSPLAQECAMCHMDPHHGQFLRTELGEETVLCKRCHTPDRWTNLQFDHNRDSRFKLDGAHEKVKCNLCHTTIAFEDSSSYILYRPLRMSCADCHAKDANIQSDD